MLARPLAPLRHLKTAGLAAVLALTVAAQPAVAVYKVSETGTVGTVLFQEPNATCPYPSTSTYLDKIKVFSPTVYGPGATIWVGWRFTIWHRTNSTGSWSKIFTSSIQKDMAWKYGAADGFSDVNWNAPANPTGQYQVRVVTLFYTAASKTNLTGRTVWQATSLQRTVGGAAHSVRAFCPASLS